MKKRGFTLIELLAVIVILAIIALIATPIVVSVINKVKTDAAKRSIDSYGRAINNVLATNYEENKKIKHLIFEDIVKDIEYSGNKIICETNDIQSNYEIYLAGCTVGDMSVDYSYGSSEFLNVIKDKANQNIPNFTSNSTNTDYLLDTYLRINGVNCSSKSITNNSINLNSCSYNTKTDESRIIVPSGSIEYVDNTKNMNKAIANVRTYDSYIIKLTSDVTVPNDADHTWGYVYVANAPNLIIDGDGHKLTAKTVALLKNYTSLTLMNIELVGEGITPAGYNILPDGNDLTINIINSKITVPQGNTGFGAINVRIWGGKTIPRDVTLNIVNSTLDVNSGENAINLNNANGTINLSVLNSTINSSKAGILSNDTLNAKENISIKNSTINSENECIKTTAATNLLVTNSVLKSTASSNIDSHWGLLVKNVDINKYIVNNNIIDSPDNTMKMSIKDNKGIKFINDIVMSSNIFKRGNQITLGTTNLATDATMNITESSKFNIKFANNSVINIYNKPINQTSTINYLESVTKSY